MIVSWESLAWQAVLFFGLLNLAFKAHDKFAELTTLSLMYKFRKDFPGKCFICSYHRYGANHGFNPGPLESHDCVESEVGK